ncbi:MAG: hypothetical protein EBU66_09430 [Bacteroidetes bacterium]|nr:hypothetical protein [bacterium]NBP64864.1 hypothetical protein [Bacteroidota bacterium]
MITFADGAESMKSAGNRLRSQTINSEVFTEVVVVNKEMLLKSGQVGDELLNFMVSQNRGFGYWVWKPVILKLALEGYWGDYEFITYMDAGCEYVDNYFSSKRMHNFLDIARKQNILAFSTSHPEERFSKKKVLNILNDVKDQTNPQVEATTIFIKNCKFSRDFISNWLEMSILNNFGNLDDEIEDESDNFLEHRHDQSVFSVLYKNFQLKSLKNEHPVMKNSQTIVLPSCIAFASWPIWQVRNRTGESLIKGKCNSYLVGAFSYGIFPFRSILRTFVRFLKGIKFYLKYQISNLIKFHS